MPSFVGLNQLLRSPSPLLLDGSPAALRHLPHRSNCQWLAANGNALSWIASTYLLASH